ncbi:MAG: hypothetical protein JW855_00315 [Gammaproteobacteria bacterium]|nr:hypothetical protein [Gammaproteobacteria bacterium]
MSPPLAQIKTEDKLLLRLEGIQERLIYLSGMEVQKNSQADFILNTLEDIINDLSTLEDSVKSYPESPKLQTLFNEVFAKVKRETYKQLQIKNTLENQKELMASEIAYDSDKLKEENYTQWLKDTIEATWNDLNNLSLEEEKSTSGLEYFRRVINEVKQELHKTKQRNMKEETRELERLLKHVTQCLQKTQTMVREHIKPKRKRLFKKILKPIKFPSSARRLPEKRGFLKWMKDLFVVEEEAPQKPVTSQGILAMMEKGEQKPSKLRLFANVLSSTAAGTSAYDSHLFGDKTIYKSPKEKEAEKE